MNKQKRVILIFCLAIILLTMISCNKYGRKLESVQNGPITSITPLPKTTIENKNCHDNDASSIRLLGANPHVPFAIITNNQIMSAGQPCCLEWASSRDIWYSLNEKGQVVGEAIISDGEGYDVTQCIELEMEIVKGNAGIGFFTSKKVNWSLKGDWKWHPTRKEINSADKLMSDLEKLIVNRETKKGRQVKGVISNQVSKTDSFGNSKMEFFEFQDYKCAVIGRKALIIAYLNNINEWVIAFIDKKYSNEDPYAKRIYSPVALYDIDRDEVPEIIYFENAGTGWCYKIVKMHNYIGDWRIVAESISGALI